MRRDSKGRFIKKSLPKVFIKTAERSMYRDLIGIQLFIHKDELQKCDSYKNVAVMHKTLSSNWGEESDIHKGYHWADTWLRGVKGTDGREKVKEYYDSVVARIVDAQATVIIEGYRYP